VVLGIGLYGLVMQRSSWPFTALYQDNRDLLWGPGAEGDGSALDHTLIYNIDVRTGRLQLLPVLPKLLPSPSSPRHYTKCLNDMKGSFSPRPDLAPLMPNAAVAEMTTNTDVQRGACRN
jgi:hypothetical protein